MGRYCARLVAKGYSQVPGKDFFDTFAPVARFESVRTILAFAIQNDLQINQFDVATAFLYGDLDEEIYMRQPPGFINKDEEHLVWKLKKSLYGLKQSSRCWNRKIDESLKQLGYLPCLSDPCIYVKFDEISIIILYVDDIIVASSSSDVITEIQNALKK